MRIDTITLEVQMAAKGMTQRRLAEESGISRQSICTMLNRGTCSAISAVKIADALGVQVKDFVVGR